MAEDSQASVALSVADVLDHDHDKMDRIEGLLLTAGGNSDSITPASIAREASLARESAGNLFRQLEAADAVSRTSHDRQVVDSEYLVDTSTVRELLGTTRQAIDIIAADRERQPPKTEAEPLVTFPDDPAFTDETAARFGMSQLLSAIASEMKDATDSIVIVAPFFEGTGLERLHEVLADAVARGVELTIITRYLTDVDSHNRSVIGEFVESLQDESDTAGQVRTVDYTVWDDSVPDNERHQDGARPAFTLHAKVIVFDDDAAYIGSANVTDYGFDRYLELGVLLRGPPVSRFRELCNFLLESEAASEVRLP